MNFWRTYGKEPYATVVVHGGPGAGGAMAPVARELAPEWGVLEPIQTAVWLDGQVEELRAALEGRGAPPMNVIGHSWGAWLGWLLAARHPSLVGKLILVGSGPFEEAYVEKLQAARLARLDTDEKAELAFLEKALSLPDVADKLAVFARLEKLASQTDAFDRDTSVIRKSDRIGPRGEVFLGAWREASELRRNGKLLEFGKRISCPVAAIHGDYDPHPREGVEAPLSRVVKDFRFHLLKDCGHTPWLERRAGSRFYEVLRDELRSR
ncbi:MAG: alpha/beta hydrolase [Candidatus Aminicenantes bacterium]|nr:alpha/beta hydrolase [Candidatus Aminicenantes bacterium]